MGYMTLNAIGITLVAVLALWIFYRSAKIERKRREEEKKRREEEKKNKTTRQD